jgi:hypothetical protein
MVGQRGARIEMIQVSENKNEPKIIVHDFKTQEKDRIVFKYYVCRTMILRKLRRMFVQEPVIAYVANTYIVFER